MPDAEFIDVDDPRWSLLLTKAPHDFYHRPEYVALSAKYESGRPGAFWACDGNTKMLLPLVLKPVPAHIAGNVTCYDATSPYGYPGPIFYEVMPSASSLSRILRSFRRLARGHSIASAFIRLHPLLNLIHHDSTYCDWGVVVDHGETVYIDLSQTEEAIAAKVRKSHRYEIRRLEKHGYTIEFENPARLPQFIKLYTQTMERVGAGRQYLFPDSYFQEFRNCLGTDLTFCCALAPNGDLASAAFFTHCGGLAQYHLSATAETHRRMSPGKLIIDHMIRWSKARGFHTLHLGGGYGVGSDALLNFKAGFSQQRASYRSWRAVLDADLYHRLVAGAGTLDPGDPGFFPPYRAPGKPNSPHLDRAAG